MPSLPPAASSKRSVESIAAYAASYSASGSPDAFRSAASSAAHVHAHSAWGVAPNAHGAPDSSGGAQGEWAAFCGLHFPSHSEHGGDHLAAHAPRVVTAETHAYARETDEYEQAALHKLQDWPD